MFGRKARTAALPVSVPRPAPHLAVVGSEPLDHYAKLAKELGYMPAQLLQEQLLRFLHRNQMPIYDYDAVDRYLADIAEKVEMVWIWRPLREKDQQRWEWSGRPTKFNPRQNGQGHGSYYNYGESYRPYHRAVPIHILRHVKKIQDEFGDRLAFFVSDYAVPDPDPFIMVTAPDIDKTVFGVWDEPGFGTA